MTCLQSASFARGLAFVACQLQLRAMTVVVPNNACVFGYPFFPPPKKLCLLSVAVVGFTAELVFDGVKALFQHRFLK